MQASQELSTILLYALHLSSESALTNAECYHVSTPISRGDLSGVSPSDAKLVPEKRLFCGLQTASTAVDAELKAGKSRPSAIGKHMSHLLLRVWLMVSCTLALSAVIVRLAWEIYVNPLVATLAVVTPVIVVIAGTNALVIYLLIAPSMRKLKSLPVGIGIIGIFTAGVIGSIVHYIRFIPSPEGDAPLSIAIATLLLIAVVSGYLPVLWVFWFIGIKKRH